MGSRTVLYLTLFLAIAGVAGIFARAYFSEQTAEAAIEPEPEGPKIIVADRGLAVGAFLNLQDVRWKATKNAGDVVLSQHFVEGAATLESMVGAVVRRPLETGEAVTAAQIIKPGQRGFLAAVLRPGMRAVTVQIDKVSGNSGLVFPGDHVDLILTLELIGGRNISSRSLASETILKNVRVIAMGQRVETFASIDAQVEERPATTATLEVVPEHAERINVAQQLGRLALSLRSLADETGKAEDQIIGGILPDPNNPDSQQMTWASDVSAALRAQEVRAAPAVVPEKKAPRRQAAAPPPPLVLMRGGERATQAGR